MRARANGVCMACIRRVSLHPLPRLIRFALPPSAHQFVELGIAAIRQHNAGRGEKIALAVPAGKASALEAEGTARTGSGGYRQLDLAVKGRYAHLGSEHRLIERNRKLDPQVRAVTLEQR